MIFLGAGASKPFGIPTLEEFSQDVIKQLEMMGHNDVIERIQDSLREFDIQLDFESLYSVLEGLTDPEKSVKSAGPLVAYFIGRKDLLPKRYDYTQVLEDLRGNL